MGFSFLTFNKLFLVQHNHYLMGLIDQVHDSGSIIFQLNEKVNKLREEVAKLKEADLQTTIDLDAKLIDREARLAEVQEHAYSL